MFMTLFQSHLSLSLGIYWYPLIMSSLVLSAEPSQPPPPSSSPPITFSLSVNKLWHHDSDVCAAEWCLAPALIGKVLNCSDTKGLVMRLCFSAPYDKIKKMEALPGYSIKHGGGVAWLCFAHFDKTSYCGKQSAPVYNIRSNVFILHEMKKNISVC